MHRRKLEELNLLDDFLMFTLVNHPKFGEKFSKKLLKIILGKDFKKLKVVPQKVYYGSDTDKHGARLDVYLEEELDGEEYHESATICDIEPEQKDNEEKVEALPRRVRFYHSKIDIGSLESGADYRALKDVIVIMIMPFDPFGYNRMVYTIQNRCIEKPDMSYDDGARTIFLYTNGTEGHPTKELGELLYYMKDSRMQNARNETLKEIHEMVECVKRDSEVSLAYMRMMKREEEIAMEAARKERIKAEAELTETKTELTETKTELTETKTELTETKTELTETKTELTETKTELTETKMELTETKAELSDTKKKVAELEAENLRLKQMFEGK
ncbi:MAG: hypothetical protein IJZ53_04605 [Tyzzerella sp.]|nr:hypothetical protein [Tyzzerella sp.]